MEDSSDCFAWHLKRINTQGVTGRICVGEDCLAAIVEPPAAGIQVIAPQQPQPAPAPAPAASEVGENLVKPGPSTHHSGVIAHKLSSNKGPGFTGSKATEPAAAIASEQSQQPEALALTEAQALDGAERNGTESAIRTPPQQPMAPAPASEAPTEIKVGSSVALVDPYQVAYSYHGTVEEVAGGPMILDKSGHPSLEGSLAPTDSRVVQGCPDLSGIFLGDDISVRWAERQGKPNEVETYHICELRLLDDEKTCTKRAEPYTNTDHS